MPKLTVLDNEYATLWYHQESKIVHHEIRKFMPKGLLEQLVTAGIECLEKHRATKWLSDNRGNEVLRQQDIEWANTVSVPRAMRAGFRYWALVMPGTEVGKMQMREFIDGLGRQGVAVQVFSNPNEAMAWLESVDRV